MKVNNSDYYENLLIILSLLEDKSNQENDLVDLLSPYVEGNLEASIYLIENRKDIIQELSQIKKEK